jgi:hypothetical protein
MRSMVTPAWSPGAPVAWWRTRRRRVGGHGGLQLGRDLRCDTVHRSVRWRMWGSTGEAGMAEDSPAARLLRQRKGVVEVDGGRGGLRGLRRGRAVDLRLKRDGR